MTNLEKYAEREIDKIIIAYELIGKGKSEALFGATIATLIKVWADSNHQDMRKFVNALADSVNRVEGRREEQLEENA